MMLVTHTATGSVVSAGNIDTVGVSWVINEQTVMVCIIDGVAHLSLSQSNLGTIACKEINILEELKK